MANTKMRRVAGEAEAISTEAALVRAAVSVISSKGFAATSIQDIAREAGVAKGAFYYYFRTKNDVLTLIHSRFLDHLLGITERVAGLRSSPPEKVGALIRAMVGAVGVHKGDVAIFIQERRALSDAEAGELYAKSELLMSRISGLIDDGYSSGHFHPLISSRALAFGLLGMCSWTYQWFRPGQLTLDDIGAMYAGVVLSGLRAPGSDAPRPRVTLPVVATGEDGSTKARLTAAAIELFCERGYTATAIDDITERVGLTKGAFYVHFSSKDDVLRHIHTLVLDNLLAKTGDLVGTSPSASDAFAFLIAEMVGMVRDRRAELAVFWQERRFLTADTFTEVRHKGDAFSDRMTEVVDHGISTGEFRPVLSAKPLALALIGMCSWGYQWHRPGDPALEDIAQMYVDVLLGGLVRPQHR